MTAVTYAKAMRRCGRCNTNQPISSKGWSSHPIYNVVCPACTLERDIARREKLAQKNAPEHQT